jgi:hypothetical protein
MSTTSITGRKPSPRYAARALLAAGLVAGANLLPSAPAAADELGRLFYTPQQRQELDRRRASNIQEKEVEAVIESSVTVNGHVARSSGKTTTWLNGVPQYDTHSSRDPARVHLQDGTLKIGQTLDRNRREVKDGLQGGMRVNPTAAALMFSLTPTRDDPRGCAAPAGPAIGAGVAVSRCSWSSSLSWSARSRCS